MILHLCIVIGSSFVSHRAIICGFVFKQEMRYPAVIFQEEL